MNSSFHRRSAAKSLVNFRRCASDSYMSRSRQALALTTLTLQNTALVFLTKFSYSRGKTPYRVSTVIWCAESTKLVLSCCLLSISQGSIAVREAMCGVPANAVRLAAPSILYVIQNNLVFRGVQLLSPTLYMVCSQSKVLTTALCSVLLLGTKITRKQYAALFFLVCGMVIVQHFDQDTSTTPLVSEQVSVRNTIEGIIVVLTAAFTSGFAGVCLERLYKEEGSEAQTIWFKNVQLACLSLPVAALAGFWQGQITHEHSPFQGFDGVVGAIILLQAFGGLVVASVLRYAGNVTKCFAVSISICICAITTMYSSENRNGREIVGFAFGIFLVISSTFLYSSKI